jgi:hypothetical protein
MIRISLVNFLVLLVTSLQAQQAVYDVSAGNGNGIRFWSDNAYKIHMGEGMEYQYGPVNDYSIKSNMYNHSGRGWTWGVPGSVPVAALNTLGQMRLATNLYLGPVYAGAADVGRISLSGTSAELSITNRTVTSYVDVPTQGERWVIYNYGTATDGKLHFWSGSDKVTLTKEGRVGIGTSTPNATLQIPGGEIVVGGPASTPPALNSSLLVLSKDNNSTTYPFYVGQQGGSDLFWVRGSGTGYFMTSLGIGTTTSQGLQVNASLSSEFTSGVNNIRIGVFGDTPRIILDHPGGTPFEMDNASGRFRIYTPGVERFTITSNGQVGIGTIAPDAKLAVKGQIHAEEVKVDLSVPVPDYVFEKDYKLPSLEEIQTYITANKHLPEVPSAKEMEEKGINVGEMNLLLLKKVEELTIYLISQDHKIQSQDSTIRQMQSTIQSFIEQKK